MAILTSSSEVNLRGFRNHELAKLVRYSPRRMAGGYNLKESLAVDSLQIAQRIVIDTSGSRRGASA